MLGLFLPLLPLGAELPSRPLRQKPEAAPDWPAPRGADAGRTGSFVAAGLDRALTRQYIRQYSSPSGISWINGALRRGAPYLPFIRREIEKRGLPPELLYLPVIESGYLPTAMSSSGAAGLWQFMRNSIAPFDMRVNDWADERMDFWKATEGALRKLEENYHQFGDWPLALAAYNAGLGAVSRVIRDSGISDYWTLSERKLLKAETIQYVPKLLAVSWIISNPRQYGIELPWEEDPRWTRLPVDRSVDLELLAAAAGVGPENLKRANPELRYGVTPPEGNYRLKVRGIDAAKISAALEQTELPLLRYHFHTIRSGDTLSALALHYGVTTAQILGANPDADALRLRIGARLRIPALKDAGPPPPAEAPGAGPALSFTGSYQIRAGDTLWSIARAHNNSPEVLAEAHGMGLNDILSVGRILNTPIIER
jgi:membrane-bound lytic murein transglycosylase D